MTPTKTPAINLIELKDIHKKYLLGKTSVHALRGANLSVKVGEFTVVLGPSGSGKSTLLNIIGCLDDSTTGTYALDGEKVTGKSFNSLAGLRNRKIGFIFQSFNLIPVLNVAENVEFPCLLGTRTESAGALRTRVLELCNRVGLGKFVHHRPDELSGGQRQRVAIARALVTRPKLVLADEPTANLDSKTSQSILELMQDLNKTQGVTFLFATHDPRVMEVAARTVRIDDGLIVEDSNLKSH